MTNDVIRELAWFPARPTISVIRHYTHAGQRRLPDRSEPWASGIRQANLLHLLPKIMCDGLIYYFEQGSQIERVRWEIILMPPRWLRSALPNVLWRTNFANEVAPKRDRAIWQTHSSAG